jgi:glycine/D-amino acid oxidase-like deaminating enzyme
MPRTNHNSEHCGSYYAATANDEADYPALKGGTDVDVCVIGAGFTGIATALTLAERGYSVAVVEANRVGWGASGRNGGQLIGGISGEENISKRYGASVANALWSMRWRGHEIIYDRVEKYGIDCDLRSGFIEVALKERQLGDLQAQYDTFQQRNFPYEYRLLSRSETQEIVGSDAYVGSMYNLRDGHLHPLNLCLGEAKAASRLGVSIYERSPVVRIRHGSKPRVSTGQGHVDANTVMIAGNAYHALEGKSLSGLTFPAGSYIIATEPLPPETLKRINPRDMAICDLNEIVDYYRLSADGRLLFGGRCNYSGREPRSIKASIQPRMLKVYPELVDARIDYEWGGKIGVNLNRLPLMGRIGKNVYYSQGYAGHGVNVTHIAGEIVADAICGTMERFDLFAKIKHQRLPLGQWFSSQIIALGMLYYRIRDLI